MGAAEGPTRLPRTRARILPDDFLRDRIDLEHARAAGIGKRGVRITRLALIVENQPITGARKACRDDLALLQRAGVVDVETPRAEPHRLIRAHALADDRRFADDDARAVVDEEGLVDRRAGLNVDARFGMRDLGDDAGDHCRAEEIEAMGESAPDDRGDARIAENHFVETSGGRVAGIGRAYIRVEKSARLRDGAGEIVDDVVRLSRDPVFLAVAREEVELAADLLPQDAQHAIEGSRNEDIRCVRRQSIGTEMPGIEDQDKLFDKFDDRGARRQVGEDPSAISARLRGAPQRRELRHDARRADRPRIRLDLTHLMECHRHACGTRAPGRLLYIIKNIVDQHWKGRIT